MEFATEKLMNRKTKSNSEATNNVSTDVMDLDEDDDDDESKMDLDDHDQVDEDVEESVNDDEDDQLDWDLLPKSEQTGYIKLAVKLGHLINISLYKDSLNMLKCYKVYDKDQLEWLSDLNPVLISFIEGCIILKLSGHTDPTKKWTLLCML